MKGEKILNVANEANHIKWLLNELFVDLPSAISMGREAFQIPDGSNESMIKAAGRLRVCNHSIVLSLFKLHEIRHVYGKFLSGLPAAVTEDFFRDVIEIERRNICHFRNKHVAHVIDKDTKQPVSIEKALLMLASITGRDNNETLAFYDWICPVGWITKPCILTTVNNLRDYCKSMPGGDLERP